MNDDKTIIYVKKGKGWRRCGNIEDWKRYYDTIC